MSGNRRGFLVLLASLALLVPLVGCVFAADLVNPGILSAFGFDPESIIPSQGSVVIAFNNTTQYAVDSMYASIGESVSTAAEDFELVSATDLVASETRALAFDCPVGVVAPGGAFVVVAGTVEEVTYGGSLMVAGDDFSCGDVIQMSLVQVGGDDTDVAFAFQVQVLAGR
jgi:hypothetical protein